MVLLPKHVDCLLLIFDVAPNVTPSSRPLFGNEMNTFGLRIAEEQNIYLIPSLVISRATFIVEKNKRKEGTTFCCHPGTIFQVKSPHVTDLLKQRHAKITERFNTRLFGVIMTPLSRENKYKRANI